ncbi:hypothetical protein [Streptomyces sp. NPDC086777]|uniref:hypothetical protein n=1 Tax=Streptomyces sp. NPDC086777 TaxID=3154866 RepID=UPI00344EF599
MAAASLRELVETLPSDPALGDALVGALGVTDPLVRAAVLDVLRALPLGGAGVEGARAALATATADPDADVRAYAARGL